MEVAIEMEHQMQVKVLEEYLVVKVSMGADEQWDWDAGVWWQAREHQPSTLPQDGMDPTGVLTHF